MKLSLYQQQWFGIDLIKLAHQIGLSPKQVANSELYKNVYQNLIADEFSPITKDWIEKKHRLSSWLKKYFNRQNVSKKECLSIGCGLGIVEQPLVDEGFNIDLQECQTLSIQFLQQRHPKIFQQCKFILSQDLTELADEQYQTIMAITSTYCLTDDQVTSFVKNVKRLLKPGGHFIWYETALTLNDCIQRIKQRIRGTAPTTGALWGWKRSQSNFLRVAKKTGFKTKSIHFFDSHNQEIDSAMVGGIALNKQVAWQMVVLTC